MCCEEQGCKRSLMIMLEFTWLKTDRSVQMILPPVHLRKACYDYAWMMPQA